MTIPIDLPNPFSTRKIRPGAIDYQFIDAQQQRRVLRACRQQPRIQIVGPHGSGKSTLMSCCLANLGSSRWNVQKFATRVPDRKLTWSALRSLQPTSHTVIAIDGYETNCWTLRKSLERYCRSWGCRLIVTAHCDQGFSCGYTTHTSASLLRNIVHQALWRWCQEVEMDRNQAVQIFSSLPDLGDLFEDFSGNLRDALFALYDWFESKRPVFSAIKACTIDTNVVNPC